MSRESKRRKWSLVIALFGAPAILFAFFIHSQAAVGAGTHGGLTDYDGSASCGQCHPNKAREVHQSAHYQWAGATPEVPNMGRAGKMGGINDFCTYPNINWLFKLKNLNGQTLDSGCATCHVGMGAKPSKTESAGQLDNIDCLVCHSDTYKRTIRITNGTARFVPDPAVNILEVLANVSKPSKAACLKCHAYAGGGDGVKQGDMVTTLADPPKTLDVHMSSQGAGMDCLRCHKTTAHRIAGRGGDIRETDLSTEKVRCADCHTLTPHNRRKLNEHTAKVDCTVCHIPKFARGFSTDMRRDHSRIEIHPTKQIYEPVKTFASNVIPEYKFWNRLSYFYPFGSPVEKEANGRVLLAGPMGDIGDPKAIIHAFKHHKAVQAYDELTGYLLPVKSKLLWETGDVTAAFTAGGNAVGWDPTVRFVATDRYMSLHHTVAPKEDALQCGSCHGGSRMDFKALGYSVKAQRDGKPLCASCHDRESASFDKVHSEHVDDEKISCGVCHTRR